MVIDRGHLLQLRAAEQWLATQTGIKPSTSYRYRSLLTSQILPRWGRHRLADVTRADVAAWVADMSAHGLEPTTVRQAHRVFALVLTLAVRDGRIPRNPATGVPLPNAGRAPLLTRDEVEQLADTAGSTATSSDCSLAPACASASWPLCGSPDRLPLALEESRVMRRLPCSLLLARDVKSGGLLCRVFCSSCMAVCAFTRTRSLATD
jgi:hypothetical protein